MFDWVKPNKKEEPKKVESKNEGKVDANQPDTGNQAAAG
jgi:hypothetical protein